MAEKACVWKSGFCGGRGGGEPRADRQKDLQQRDKSEGDATRQEMKGTRLVHLWVLIPGRLEGPLQNQTQETRMRERKG